MVVDASAANTNNLDEVVVTGTAHAGGVKKLDASFEITTASLEEIRTRALERRRSVEDRARRVGRVERRRSRR